MMMDRSKLTTERRNPASRNLDRHSTLGIVDVIQGQDALVAPAVRKERRRIARVAEIIAERLGRGGRLIYVGAGTSGRLGVLDAAECPPTFGVAPTMVQGVIAGGRRALVRSAEGKEDIAADGATAIDRKRTGPDDVVVGIAACGLTPFVHGALDRASARGSATVLVTCSPQVRRLARADVVICTAVGPEVVTGSTRMKAGTATKMVLNTLTTAAMVRLGKVYGNLMVDVRATNAKLRDRAERIVMAAAKVTPGQARRLLTAADGRAKTAILMQLAGLDAVEAQRQLDLHGGRLRDVLSAGEGRSRRRRNAQSRMS